MRTLVLGLVMVAVGCGDDGNANHPPDAPRGDGSSVPFTNAALFRVDDTGTNLTTGTGVIERGVWFTETGVQNVPGNYVVRFFLATTPDPAANDLFPLADPLAASLVPGPNTFHLFADGDDVAGGTYGFGLNLWLNGAAAHSPSISAFVSTDAGSVFTVNGTTGCTPAGDATCTPGANALTSTQGSRTVTLTAFSITALGGAAASSSCVDKVDVDNTMPVVTNTPDGICDTLGTFTLTVQ